MVKQIIQEAVNKNPLGFKEAFKEELRARVALALEAKKENMHEEDLEENVKHPDMHSFTKDGIDDGIHELVLNKKHSSQDVAKKIGKPNIKVSYDHADGGKHVYSVEESYSDL